MAKEKLARNLPAPLEPVAVPASAGIAPAVPLPAAAPSPLSHYLWVLERHWIKIAVFVTAVTLGALIVTSRLTPIYESTATVEVDRQTPTGVVGQESMKLVQTDADQYIATHARLMQSDSVLRPVAERFRLLERAEEQDTSTPEERVRDAEAPVVLKKLRVVRPPNTYLLQISYRAADRQVAADVANAIAQSYLEHTYNIRYKAASGLSRFMEKQIDELRAKMERSSAALAKFERDLNIINPEAKTNILSARLLELNSEFARAQADRVRRQAAFGSIESGSAEAARVSSQAESLKRLTDDLNTARQRFAEVKTHFGPNHPEHIAAQAQVTEIEKQLNGTVASVRERVSIEYREASERERMLDLSLKAVKDEMDGLNARSFEYQALKREAEEDKKLYDELVRKIREATINSSFQSSSSRIADPARPGRKPVFPAIALTTSLAFVFSLLAAVGIAVISDVLDDTVRDPEQVKRSFGADVIGTLPEVKVWRRQPALVGRVEGAPAAESLVSYEEAVRTLRNSILLADMERHVRSLLVTSASPGEGKSTIAGHLAVAHAENGLRTLLIDGDLRRPSVHKRFGLRNAEGLADVLLGNESWRNTVQRVEGIPNLDILPAGSTSPRRASDLIGKGLQQIFDETTAEYDLVIIDAPPLLGFAEPLQMATVVDGVLVVAKAGSTSRTALASVMSVLRRVRAGVAGVVLNEVTRDSSSNYYYYGQYRKYYASQQAASNNS